MATREFFERDTAGRLVKVVYAESSRTVVSEMAHVIEGVAKEQLKSYLMSDTQQGMTATQTSALRDVAILIGRHSAAALAKAGFPTTI